MGSIWVKIPPANANGENPLRWDCEKQGCFNKKMRPKLEQFADCFPRRINFGDVDGLVEINSQALLLEWKTGAGRLKDGQRIMLQNLTRDGSFIGLVVVGDAETMTVSHMGTFENGKQGELVPATLENVKDYIKRWAEGADTKGR